MEFKGGGKGGYQNFGLLRIIIIIRVVCPFPLVSVLGAYERQSNVACIGIWHASLVT